jgi:hypothetical protein
MWRENVRDMKGKPRQGQNAQLAQMKSIRRVLGRPL